MSQLCGGSAPLSSPPSLAKGLRELVLQPQGLVAAAVSAGLACVGSLTQLDSLQLHSVALVFDGELLVAALSLLTGLTRLDLGFAAFDWDYDPEALRAFPWEDAVCGLTQLQRLRVTTASERDKENCADMFRGALPAALSRLTALRRCEVLGMDDQGVRDDSNQLQLSALPALETAALRLHTLAGVYPGLSSGLEVVLSRLISLSLALRVDTRAADPYADTGLPAVIAPALTELTLDDIKLAPDCAQLGWLPGLLSSRRLVLRDIKMASGQMPQGIAECSALTELVMQGMLVGFGSEPGYWNNTAKTRVCSLPAAGPFLSQLVRLDLSRNAFRGVPLSLAAATALEELSLSKQQLRKGGGGRHAASPQGLPALENLPRLRRINLLGFKGSGPGVQSFRAARPDVSITI